ncbi:MAG: ABC transporter ATP-binding protein [Thermoplasmatales archaeon]|nr:ABC transporter ATP-binding protein [Thermoplasmatales archaeon]
MEEKVIVVEDLRREFVLSKDGKRKTALDGISFDVNRGEIFGILGHNNAGKTTLIKILTTLLLPTSGKAEVLGLDVYPRKNEKPIRRRINVVMGGERGLYYRLTARQNMKFFADLYGIPKKTQHELIEDLLELVKLTPAADQRVENFSRGMKQRLHIAKALVNDPEILFLDEPTIGMDPEITRDVIALVRKLAVDGTTILLTTHHMREAEALCDRVAIMASGKIVAMGTLSELKEMAADASIVRITTVMDPYAVTLLMEDMEGISSVKTELVSGRYVTSVGVEDGRAMFDRLNTMFDGFDIRGIEYDDPTLEDAYLHILGGEGDSY